MSLYSYSCIKIIISHVTLFHAEVNITCAASDVAVVTIDCSDLDAALEYSFNSGPLRPCELIRTCEHNIT